MGIISRFTDIMSANINSMLSKAEGKNADKLLEKYLNDAREDLGKVKAETAAVMAEETAAKRKLDDCDTEIKKLEGYAMSAVKAGNDDDARKFLQEKGEVSGKRVVIEQNYQLAKSNSDKMKEMTSKLMEDISAATSKLDMLKAQLSVAKSQEKMNKLTDKMGGSSALSRMGDLEAAVQKRIDTAQAAQKLNSEFDTDSELEDLKNKYDSPSQNNSQIDDELEKLKASLA